METAVTPRLDGFIIRLRFRVGHYGRYATFICSVGNGGRDTRRTRLRAGADTR